jgi:hypothetical protein
MRPSAPGRRRATTTSVPGGLRIVLPARRRWGAAAFLAVWLCGWGFGLAAVLGELLGQGVQGERSLVPALFLVVWLAGWSVGGAVAAWAAAWNVAGREVVTVTGTRLTVRREVLGIGRTAAYDAAAVRDLRVEAPRSFPFAPRRWDRWPGGPIAFDAGGATRRFGAGVDEAEAEQLVAALRARLPSA